MFYGSHPFFKVYCLHSLDHLLSFAVTHCHLLSLTVIRCLSLLLFVTHCTTCCRLSSFVVPLIVIHCTTRCHSMSLSAIHCQSLYHSLLLDVPLFINVRLFINDLYLKSFCKRKKLANLQIKN